MTRHEKVNPRQYAAEINYVAELKAKGVVPLTLEATDPEEAATLRFTMSLLDGLGLMRFVDERINTILQQARRDEKIKPKPPFHPQSSSFYGPEEGIVRLHNDDFRAKLQQTEATRQRNRWHRFLHDIGQYDYWPQKREKLTRKMTEQADTLKRLGVWDEFVREGATAHVIQTLRQALLES